MKCFLSLLLVLSSLTAKEKTVDTRENYFLTSTDLRISPQVNPITGEYSEDETDLIVAGSQPLSLRRFYNHFAPYDPRYATWRYNPESFLGANLEWIGQEIFAAIGEVDGSVCSLKPSKTKRLTFQFDTPKGFATLASSGQTHPLNTKITYTKFPDPKDKHRFEYRGKIVDGTGRIRNFHSPMHRWNHQVHYTEIRKHGLGAFTENKYCYRPNTWTPFPIPITEETLPNGNILCYTYTRWKAPKRNYPRPALLKSITAYNADKTKILSTLNFRYGRNKNDEVTSIHVTGSDGRKVDLRHVGKDRIVLANAKRPGLPPISYHVPNGTILGVRKPDGRVLSTKYQPRTNKVSSQHAPVGPKGEMLPIARYDYQKQATTVYDAEDNKITYHFDEHKKITRIETYRDDLLYRSDHFTWDEVTGNLLSKTLQDSSATPLKITEYLYDHNQNPVMERTGDGALWRTITRTFSDDGFNLLLTETDREGKRTRYTYLPGTNLPASELVYARDTLCKRTFHFYDDCAIRIKTVIDDGSAEDPYDLQEVTYRRITETIPKQEMPCFGLPETVLEKTIDAHGSEILLRKVVYTYTPFGKVLQEDHYDDNGDYRYSRFNTYDDNEKLICTKDPLGAETSFSYDANFNLTSIAGPLPDQHKEITYDKANRPIRIADRQCDGTLLTLEKKYDKLGRVIEELDACGQTTCFVYDALGRVTSITRPDGAIERKEYDVLGNLTKEIDPKGYETSKIYHVFGQPLSIFYPDGSEEHFTYTTTGQVASHTDKNGATTTYTYDLFDHPIQTQVHSPEGELLKTSSATWTPFHKLSETDAKGVCTTYTYDFVGRKTGQRTAYQQTSCSYDALGRLSSIQEEESLTTQEYDLCDRLIGTKTESGSNLQAQEAYAYDEAGNRTHTIRSQGTTKTVFNTYGKPLSTQDPLGHVTTFAYAYQDCFTQTITNPKGVQTLSIHDSRGREALSQKKNAQGALIQQSESQYDKSGNPTTLTHTVFSGETPLSSITHVWEYGPMDRIERFLEAGERETRYLYDDHGRLETIVKPNGCELKHEYDALGRLARYCSRDFDYHYTYDKNDLLTRVYDAVSQTETSRSYDLLGNMIEENLASNLSFISVYDTRGRRVALILPDESEARYTYEGIYLQTVSRGKYTHTYARRNLEGQVLEAVSPAGEICVERDALGRYVSMDSPGFSASNLNYDAVGNLLSYDYRDLLGQVECSYTYDAHDQLVSENEHAYTCDSLHNRLKKDGDDYGVNSLCQVTSDGRATYVYDLCGNLIADGKQCYTYDCQDRLIAIEEGETRIEYTYDPFHRRLSKAVFLGKEQVAHVRYLWDGDDEIGSVDKEGCIQELRVLGEGLGAEIGAAVLYELGDRSYVPVHDHRGCVVGVVDPEGQEALECYRYTAFGEELAEGRVSPWRFSSKRVEEAGLVFFGRRYYHPELGRWITQDPEGFDDGPNLYAYVSNAPLTRLDLYGLKEYLQNRFAEFAGSPFTIPSYPLLFEPSVPPQFGLTFETGFSEKSRLYDLRPTFNRPELPGGRGIFFVNGMNNTLDDARGHLRHLSDLAGGFNLKGAYNATHGGAFDLLESAMGLVRGTQTDPSAFIHAMWDGFMDIAPPDMLALHFCTSQGAILTKNALETYSEERRKRIRVIGIAPAAYIPKEICHSVRNYQARFNRDPVPRIAFRSRRKHRDSIQVVPSHPDADRFDHSFSSPTYEKYIRQEIVKYFTETGN